MKALLVTRCGCTKLVDIDGPRGGMYMPLKPKLTPVNPDEPITTTTGMEDRDRYFAFTRYAPRMHGVEEQVLIYEEQ